MRKETDEKLSLRSLVKAAGDVKKDCFNPVSAHTKRMAAVKSSRIDMFASTIEVKF